jgi:predicted O-methyltransferase YrrM
LLENLLKPTDQGLEWGSGRSTIWLAKHVAHLTSVEHDSAWFERVREHLKDEQLKNVRSLLFVVEKENIKEVESANAKTPYVDAVDNFPENSLDFVLIDGICRGACANRVIKKIRSGGILVLDNANWFIPYRSTSPDSRTIQDGPATSEWSDFLKKVQNWRRIWTSNGVTDTAIWFKV